jgi:hypothetical protein
MAASVTRGGRGGGRGVRRDRVSASNIHRKGQSDFENERLRKILPPYRSSQDHSHSILRVQAR